MQHDSLADEKRKIELLYEEIATRAKNKWWRITAKFAKRCCDNWIATASQDVINAIVYKEMSGAREYLFQLISIPSVAVKLGEWRDPRTGNNILHYFCKNNDAPAVSLLVARCGDALLHTPNLKQKPPYLLVNGKYRLKCGIFLLRRLKEAHNVDLSPIKNSIVDEITKRYDRRYRAPKYYSYFKIAALEMFQESNMITEEDKHKLDAAAAEGIKTWFHWGPNSSLMNGTYARCYVAALNKREYKYDTTLWDAFDVTTLHIAIASLPEFIWCLLDRNLTEKEALVVLQYCSKLFQKRSTSSACIQRVIKSLLAPCLVKYPALFLASDLPPLCYYILIELENILSYDLSESVVAKFLEYADYSLWAPYRNKWNNLPSELIAIIIGYMPPRITKMFAILNKRLSIAYSRHKATIWRQKYEKEMPDIKEPDLSGKLFLIHAKWRRYDTGYSRTLGQGRLKSLEVYKKYLLFATYFSVCAVIDTETYARRDFLNEDANFCVRIYEDLVFRRRATECDIFSLIDKTRQTFPLKAVKTENLIFAVNKEWIMSQDGLFDIGSGGQLVQSRLPGDEFDSCMFMEGLCYEQTATQIKVLDPREKVMQVGSCQFNSGRLKGVKFNVAGHNLVVASDKIDIFDTRDLTRAILSSPNLDTKVKILDLHAMRAFTTHAAWNLNDMTYIWGNKPYYFSHKDVIAVTNGARVFSYESRWGESGVFIETARSGSPTQNDSVFLK